MITKVHFVTRPSIGLDRILHYLIQYMPDNFQRVSSLDKADLAVLFVCGRRDQTQLLAQQIVKDGKQYAVIQIALGSTRNPDPNDWATIWQGANVVWSYYSLPIKDQFYHAPMGADPLVFHPLALPKKYIIAMTGQNMRKECLFECRKAAFRIGEKTYLAQGITDSELNRVYNSSWYVNGLRRDDGFEMPAAEALIAGTRPIMFDNPNFRQWFDGLAVFVPERPVSQLVDELVKVLSKQPKPMTPAQIQEARDRFNWRKIVTGFWERCE